MERWKNKGGRKEMEPFFTLLHLLKFNEQQVNVVCFK